MLSISVIVLNWNGRDLLPTCLQSLQMQSYRDFEVILVDNASTDGSVAWVQQHLPWVRVLVLDRNYGFCAGNNRGINEATGRYIVLLNNDTECQPDFLQALYQAIEAHPEVGLCATRMLRLLDHSRVDNCGIGLRIIGLGHQIGAGEANGPRFDRTRYVFGASGGAVLYRRTMLEQIGLLDEDFFSHVEDVDLSWRAQLAGYRCLYVPQAIVYHMGGATSKRMGQEVLYRIQRNCTWTYLKNMPTVMLLLTSPIHLLYSWYWLLRAATFGQARMVWRAKLDALQAWPRIRQKRREIQTRRRLSLIHLLRLMD